MDYPVERVVVLDDGSIAGFYGTHVAIFDATGTIVATPNPQDTLEREGMHIGCEADISPDGRFVAYFDGNKLLIWSVRDDASVRLMPIRGKRWPDQGFPYALRWRTGGIVAYAYSEAGDDRFHSLFVIDDTFTVAEVAFDFGDTRADIDVATDGSHFTRAKQLFSFPKGKRLRPLGGARDHYAISDAAKTIVYGEMTPAGEPSLVREGAVAPIIVTEFPDHVAITRDGMLVACRGYNGLSVVDVEAGKERFHRQFDDRLACHSVSATRVVCAIEHQIIVLDAATGNDLSGFDGVLGVGALCAGMAVLAKGSALQVYDLDGSLVRTIALGGGSIARLVTAGDLLFVHADGVLQLVELGGKIRWSTPTSPFSILDSLAISDDGTRVAAGVEILAGDDDSATDGKIWRTIVWNAKTGAELFRGPVHRAPLQGLALSADGSTLASVSATSFEHGDLHGDNAVVTIVTDGVVTDNLVIAGCRPIRIAAYDGDDLLISSNDETWRYRDKKVSKLAGGICASAADGHTLRAFGDRHEIWKDGARNAKLAIDGRPVAVASEGVLIAGHDGTYSIQRLATSKSAKGAATRSAARASTTKSASKTPAASPTKPAKKAPRAKPTKPAKKAPRAKQAKQTKPAKKSPRARKR